MKKTIYTSLIILCALLNTRAQESGKIKSENISAGENYGQTLNLGLGIGYYGYVGHNIPVIHLNYEFQVARNITIAPFITAYSFGNTYYWGNPKYPYRYYNYTETVIPVGGKLSYYFDQLLKAGPKWDFYLAGSLGFVIRQTSWESGYYGETTINRSNGSLYIDLHIGTEYHMNNKLGLFLDLSSGVSTFGLAIHF